MRSKLLNKKTIAVFVILLLGGYSIFARSKGDVALVTPVEIENVVVEKTVSGTGTVTSENEVNLSFPITGRITEINVSKGDFTEASATLARVDGSSAYFTAQSRQEALDAAKRDVSIYIENYETNPNAVGGRDEYELNVKKLKDLVDVAEANYNAAWSGLNSYYISAPFGGTVLDVNGKIGEAAVAGSTIIKLADLDKLIIEVELDQEDFSFVRLEQNVEISLDAYPESSMFGKVVDMPLFVDSADQESFVVKIAITENNELPVLLGMDGDVSIQIASTVEEVPALTFDQIYYDEDEKSYVWVNSDGTLTKKYIDVGLEGDIYTELKSEINEQLVAPANTEQDLEEGMQVKLAE